MLTRIITAIVALCAFIPILIFSDTVAFPIAMALLSCIGAVELLRCVGMKKITFTAITVLIALAVPMGARYIEDKLLLISTFFAVFFVYLIIILASSVFSKGQYDTAEASTTFTMVFYIVASFSSIVLLRDSVYGTSLYLLAFLGPWMSDTMAYFCGRAFGKHKLIPNVSPKKTVEGSIGGITFTGIAFAFYGYFMIDGAKTPLAIAVLFVMGVLVSVVSQIGDLIASLIKRKYGIKDYGKLFPGHGGVLDRFDSVLITAPVILIIAEIAARYNIFG